MKKAAFAFPGLSPGEYSLELEGLGPIASGIKLEDEEIFFLLMPFKSTVQGKVLGLEEGATLSLVSEEFGWKVETTCRVAPAFRFENLPRGKYRIVVGDKEIGEVETDGLSTFALPDLSLEGPFSSIKGKVLDDLGKPMAGLKLTLLREGNPVAESTSEADGSYQFLFIRAGVYDVKAEGFGLVKSGIEVDGESSYQVDIVIPAVRPRKALSRCLYFGAVEEPIAQANFLIALRYMMATRTPAVFSLKDASQAQEVIIVGDERVVGPEKEQALKEAGCDVRRIPGDSYAIARALGL
jgi:hypothetical protein